jgi:uncharacterized RDD family membrane protein YckC
MEMNEVLPPALPSLPMIAGFWRRVFAFAIDFILLGLVGLISGIFLFDFYARLGAGGRFVGFVVAAAYFGVLDSRLSGGQTPGKRAVHIRVVDNKNRPLTFARSLARFVVLGIPFFLNGAPLPNALLHGFGAVLVTVLIFGVGASIVYLFIFNRRTRQSLHDIAVGSLVVSTEAFTSNERENVWAGHLAAVALICGISLLLPILSMSLASSSFFQGMQEAVAAIEQQPGVQFASMSKGSTFHVTANGRSSATYISVRVVADRPLKDCAGLSDRCARVLMDTYSQASSVDILQITVSYGFDIGIASSWKNSFKNYKPNELRGSAATATKPKST